MKLRFKPRLTLQGVGIAALIAGTLGLLLFRLGSMLPGFAMGESRLVGVRASVEALWHQPLFILHDLSSTLAALVLPGDGLASSRIPSVLLAFLVVGLLFWLLRLWYGYRLALFGGLLLISAPLFLHVARLGAVDVSFPLAMTIVLVLAALWHKQEHSRLLIYGSAIASASLMYVPGALWLLLCALVFERKNIFTAMKSQRLHSALAIVLGLILLIPLGHMLQQDSQSYMSVLGLPEMWRTPLEYLKEFGQTWQYLFIGGYYNPLYNLGRLPLINIFMTLTTAVGVYLYSRHPKAPRTKLMLSLWIVGSVLVTLGLVHISVLLPVIVVLASGGMGYLLHLWLKVFPKNPIARNFGIGLLAIVVLMAVLYNVRSYYVAWPNTEATRQVFSRQL
jgi:hypothetical protein